MNNNYNIINNYNINYHNIIYDSNIYSNSTIMVRNSINQIYDNNNLEEFMQEQHHIMLLQEYENEVIRLRMQNQEYINLNQIRLQTQRIVNIDEDAYLRDGDEFIETCPICLDDVEHIESTSKLSCGHHFHTNCIRLCLERNLRCPLCRQNCLIN